MIISSYILMCSKCGTIHSLDLFKAKVPQVAVVFVMCGSLLYFHFFFMSFKQMIHLNS